MAFVVAADRPLARAIHSATETGSTGYRESRALDESLSRVEGQPVLAVVPSAEGLVGAERTGAGHVKLEAHTAAHDHWRGVATIDAVAAREVSTRLRGRHLVTLGH